MLHLHPRAYHFIVPILNFFVHLLNCFVFRYDNKSAFSFLRQLITWHCPHLLLRALLRRSYCWEPDSNRSISPPCRAHSNKPAAAACGGRVRQTDWHTDVRQLHSPCSAYYAGSADNSNNVHHHLFAQNRSWTTSVLCTFAAIYQCHRT